MNPHTYVIAHIILMPIFTLVWMIFKNIDMSYCVKIWNITVRNNLRVGGDERKCWHTLQ